MTTERDDEVPVPLRGERIVPGSVNALIASYYCSPEFRRNNRRVIEQFRNEHGTTLIARFDRAHIKEIIGAKATTREAANNLLKVLCMLLNHGVKIGMTRKKIATSVMTQEIGRVKNTPSDPWDMIRLCRSAFSARSPSTSARTSGASG